ncbi:MAG: GUN4 domain-containing protein [Synechococcaceae cyanobacterium ELA182]
MLSGPPVTSTARADQLLERFLSGSQRQRRSLLGQIEQRRDELVPLIPDQLDRLDATGDDWAAGLLVQMLLAAGTAGQAEDFLARHPGGWLALSSAAGLDYAPLQQQLMQRQFEEADRLTSALLRQLAGPGAEQRGYVFFSEVATFPSVDLESLDRLWVCYSRGRFGFSVQGRLLQGCNGQWERLWPRLGWKQGGRWTRYPGSFTWSLEAPEGHMPLVNQLRGVRLMDALLHHPALLQRSSTASGR